MTSPVTDAMIEAGVDAYGRMLGNYTIQEIVSEIYLAMKAKEEAVFPADEVERVARALWDCKRANIGLQPAPFSTERTDFHDLARAALSAIKGQQSTVDEVEQLIDQWWNKLPVYDDGGAPDRASITRDKLAEIIGSAIRNGDEGMGS